MRKQPRTDWLEAGELDLWRAWKGAQEVVVSRVVSEITHATGLTEAEFSVLARLDEDGGQMRQNRLADLMGWHRSRLSHQLSRMENRGWLSRHPVDGGVGVEIDPPGQSIIDIALPIHAAAVRRHLLGLFDEAELADLHEALRRLAAPH